MIMSIEMIMSLVVGRYFLYIWTIFADFCVKKEKNIIIMQKKHLQYYSVL